MEEENKDFIGLGKFVWWFGIVENRFDPLNIGRCKVRCFGWHTHKQSEISVDDLPWAHPVVPYGAKAVQPPSEGTMVFGFFADGQEGAYPILMGIIPGVPEELRNETSGFSDPYSELEKQFKTDPLFPRKVANSNITTNASGPRIENDIPRRYPNYLNEPTVSRLARPNRIESPIDGSSIGVRSDSIQGTTIDFQRRNRITHIKSAKSDSALSSGKQRYQTTWNEPFPSFNARYPFNHVTETESGHAFELDDTPDFERVQISHRTGSTLEFLPSGSVKQKTFNNKYDITMGNHKSYVNGTKEETIQSDMFLKINGKLVIQCDGIDFESAGDINMKGFNIKITADNKLDIFSQISTRVYGGAGLDLRTEGKLRTYGGSGAIHGSGGLTDISGTINPIAQAVREAILATAEKNGLTLGQKEEIKQDTESTNILSSGVRITGGNFWINTLLTTLNSAITNILPPTSLDPPQDRGPKVAKKFNAPVPKIKKTKPTFKKEPTDKMAFLEQNKIRAEEIDKPGSTNQN